MNPTPSTNPTPDSPNEHGRKYWCFISYRHADNKDQDRDWASWLHQEIERYDIPAELVGTQNKRGDTIPERIYPVFRDEESLPADADLANSIEIALDRSRFLTVLCSPRAVESQYVAQEIEHFKQTGKGDRIIAAIIAGEPGDPDAECFPAPLREVVNEDGKVSEPIAADFRLRDGGEGFTSAEAYLLQLKDLARREARKLADAYESQLQLMKLKVIAGIIGVPLEQLRDRDKAYQLELARKRAKVLRLWLAAVGFLAIVAMGAAWFALNQQKKSERRLAENHWNSALFFRDRENDNWAAMHHFAEAAAVSPDAERADTAAVAVQGLVPGLRLQANFDNFRVVTRNKEESYFVAQKRVWKGEEQERLVRRWDARTGREVKSFLIPVRGPERFLANGAVVEGQDDKGTPKWWNTLTGNETSQPDPAVALDLTVNDEEEDEPVRQDSQSQRTMSWKVYENEDPASLTRSTLVTVMDNESDSEVFSFQTSEFEDAAFFAGGSQVVLTNGENGAFEIWDLAQQRRTAISPVARFVSLSSRIRPDIEAGNLVISTFDEWEVTSHVRIWQPVEPPKKSPLETSVFGFVQLSGTGDRILTTTVEGSTAVWESEVRRQLPGLDLKLGERHQVQLSPDGSRVLAVNAVGEALMYDAGGKKLTTLRAASPVRKFRFTTDSNFILTWTEAGSVDLWNAADGGHTCRLTQGQDSEPTFHFGSTGGIRLVSWVRADREFVEANCVEAQSQPVLNGNTPRIQLDLNGNRFLIDRETGGYFLLKLPRNERMEIPVIAHWGLQEVFISLDGQFVAELYNLEESGTTFRVRRTKNGEFLWNPESKDPTRQILSPNEYIKDVVFRPDNKAILTMAVGGESVVGEYFVIRQWDMFSGKAITPATRIPFAPDESGSYEMKVAYGLNQRIILATYDRDVHVIDTHTGAPLIPRVRHPSKVRQARVLEGPTLVTTTEKGKVHFWSLNPYPTWPKEEWPLKVQVWTGTRLNSSRDVESIPAEEWWELKRRHDEIQGGLTNRF